MAIKSFDEAKRNKADEFYTTMDAITEEMKHYKNLFKNKTVFCNCDDPYESNFFKYFAINFNFLGLKQLIVTCYDGSSITGTQLSLFDENPDIVKNRQAYKAIINEVKDFNEDGCIDLNDVETLLRQQGIVEKLNGNGDFRSDECIELLNKADIVVTNPPFSLFRDFVKLLVDKKKDYIIIGNTNALTYKEIFSLFKEDKIRTGYTNFNVGMFFIVPDSYEKYHHIDEHGHKIARVSTSCWFTSLPVKKHNDILTLYKKYDASYQKYENYDAINVDNYKDIPMDYDGCCGVPITFLDKYNPAQFEIVALGIVGSCIFTSERKMELLDNKGACTGKYTVNAKGTLYRKYRPGIDKAPSFKDVLTGELYSSIYARIIVKRKKVN